MFVVVWPVRGHQVNGVGFPPTVVGHFAASVPVVCAGGNIRVGAVDVGLRGDAPPLRTRRRGADHFGGMGLDEEEEHEDEDEGAGGGRPCSSPGLPPMSEEEREARAMRAKEGGAGAGVVRRKKVAAAKEATSAQEQQQHQQQQQQTKGMFRWWMSRAERDAKKAASCFVQCRYCGEVVIDCSSDMHRHALTCTVYPSTLLAV